MNTILFDLDGTLLPMDMGVFEREYFKRLTLKLESYFPQEEAVKYIWDATMEMVLNIDPNKTNKEIFMDKFSRLTSRSADEMYSVFMDFYRKEYKELKQFIKPSKHMTDSVKILKEKGYRLVIATNPLFPMEAVLDRVSWAGLEKEDFELITSFEEMHYCKPQIHYYKEIMDIIKASPEECLMVGNDVEEDLAAGKIGIKTFLIQDNILNKKGITLEADYKGSCKDFYEFTIELPQK